MSVFEGTPVEQGRFPFQAGLLFAESQYCSGTLIAPNVVLTAAHCDMISPRNVVLGCEETDDLGQCELIPVKKSSVFEGFDLNNGLFHGDILLLVLEVDSVQKPIALASPGFNLDEGQQLTVIGWGPTNPFPEQSNEVIMLEAVVDSISQESCDEQYKDLHGRFGSAFSEVTPIPGTAIDDSKLCAIGRKEFCLQDSGGPILMRCDTTGQDLQVGISSFKSTCAHDGIAGVYTSVFHPDAFEFIENVVADEGHSLSTFGSPSEFCVVGGTQRPEQISDPPTPFPSFNLAGWTCNSIFFAAHNGCHCNCGIPDPDCDLDFGPLHNCQDEEICVDGICVDARNITLAPTTETESPTSGKDVPPEWICSKDFYADGVCDCNCGAPDPDCEDGADVFSDDVLGCPNGEKCIDDVCVNLDATSSPTISPTFSPTKSPVLAQTPFPTTLFPSTGNDDDNPQNIFDELFGSDNSIIVTFMVLAVAIILAVVIYYKRIRVPSTGVQYLND